jgi:hypothetical protein
MSFIAPRLTLPRLLGRLVPRRTARERTSQRLTRVVVSGALLVSAPVVSAQPASALTYSVQRGPYDMRAYVSTPSSVFGCGPGYVYLSGLTVRNPFSYGVRVYQTYVVQRWNGSSWPVVASGSVQPNGVYLAPGASLTFARNAVPSFSGYYYANMQADFHVYSNGAELGDVTIHPDLAGDWSSTYRYQGSRFSYCWHG